MSRSAAGLPEDPAELRRFAAALAAEVHSKTLLIEKLRMQLAVLRRARFGRSSEKLDREIEQLELLLGDIEESDAERQARTEASDGEASSALPSKKPSVRTPLPDHLPLETVMHEAPCVCPTCGATKFGRIGADERMVLEYVPSHFKRVLHVRPKMSCRACETVVQAPMPTLPIEKGRPGPALLAHVLVSKYCDHLPLHRQADIYGRSGVEIDRSVMAGWVGHMAALLEPLAERIARHVRAGAALHADDTPVPVLDPGRGRTKTGRLWTAVRDESPYGSTAPPAAFYLYSPDRKAERAHALLKGCRGHLHADAYAGFAGLYEADPLTGAPAPLTEVACWAHARRKIYDIHVETKSPAAAQALEMIARLFAIEADIKGKPPAERLAARRAKATPILSELRAFLDATMEKISGKSSLAGAFRYAASRWTALTRYVGDGRLEMSNNAAERAMRPLATTESFCAPSSSVCKHGNLVLRFEVTRAAFAPHRSNNALALKVGGPDLVRRASDDLLCRQNSGFDQPADAMARNPTLLRGLSQGQPGPVLLGGAIGVDTSHAPDRSDTVRCPGFALAGRQSHAVQSGGDVLIRPAGRHAADDGQGVVRGVTVVAARPRLAEPELGVLAALPVDDQNDLTRRFIDVDGDLVHQRSQQLLSGAHRDAGRLPRGLEVLGQAHKIRRRCRRDGLRRSGQSRLAVLNAA